MVQATAFGGKPSAAPAGTEHFSRLDSANVTSEYANTPASRGVANLGASVDAAVGKIGYSYARLFEVNDTGTTQKTEFE